MTTEAERDTQLQNIVALADNLRSSQTVPADTDTFQDSIKSSRFSSAQTNAALAFREAVNGAFGAPLRRLLNSWARAYSAEIVAYAASNDDEAWRQVFDYWKDNAKHVESRGMSFGSASAASGNVGDGTISRLTVDENGDAIDSARTTVKTFTCVVDGRGRTNEHQEIFRVRDAPSKDFLDLAGTGQEVQGGQDWRAQNSRQGSLIKNGGFQEVSGSTTFSSGLYSLTSSNGLTGWTFDTGQIQDHQIDRNNFVKDLAGVSNPHSFKSGSGSAFKISQKLSVNRVEINYDLPYHLSVWVRPDGSADGNIVLTLGSQTYTTAVSGLTANTWNYVETTLDSTRWPKNWNQADAAVAIEWTGTAGTVALDEVDFRQMVRFPARNGTYWHVGGGETAWKEGDEVTFTDTVSPDKKINGTLALIDRYLPHVADATQITASGGRTITFATSDDSITLSSGDISSDGYEAGMTLTVANTSSNDGTYTIATIESATKLTVEENLTDEGPLSSSATLDATASVTDPS